MPFPMNQLAARFGRSRSTLFTIRASAEERLRQALTTNPPAAPAPRQRRSPEAMHHPSAEAA
jgi:hypothetical protein